MVHVLPYVKEHVFHVNQSETIGVYESMDEFQDQFQAMQKEIQALRGKYLFGNNAHDLCLVPNVKILHKFKVPGFEKYRGNSCPLNHLVMYVTPEAEDGGEWLHVTLEGEGVVVGA